MCTTARATLDGRRLLGQPTVDNQDEFGVPVAAEAADGSYPSDSRGYPTADATIVGWSGNCATPTRIGYVYKTTAGSFRWLADPSTVPADAAMTTTLDGQTVPYVVRWERGTINRFIYSIAGAQLDRPADEHPLQPAAGRRDARTPWDNVGVQYGLQALADGVITPTEFLDLNAGVGGWRRTSEMVPEGFPFNGTLSPENFDPWSSRQMNLSPDGGITPAPRTEGDPVAMNAAYTSGMVFDGDIDIPVIDWRHYLEDELDMHHSHQSFATRERIIDADGDAANQVIWFTDARPAVAFDQTPMAFEVIDEWMANIEAHPERSVAENRPPTRARGGSPADRSGAACSSAPSSRSPAPSPPGSTGRGSRRPSR